MFFIGVSLPRRRRIQERLLSPLRAAVVCVSGCHYTDCHYIDAVTWTQRRVEKVWGQILTYNL